MYFPFIVWTLRLSVKHKVESYSLSLSLSHTYFLVPPNFDNDFRTLKSPIGFTYTIQRKRNEKEDKKYERESETKRRKEPDKEKRKRESGLRTVPQCVTRESSPTSPTRTPGRVA